MKIKNIQDIVLPTSGSVVFVSGVTGQDGSHMVDYLLRETSASIIGGARRLSVDNHDNIKHLENEPRFQLVTFDLTDSQSVNRLVAHAKPNYFINYAAQSFVAASWDLSLQTLHANVTGVVNCLEAIRCNAPMCRFYNAGSSEEFGNVAYEPQDEKHPLLPRSPYGASKSSARHYVKVYRESFGLYAVQGWLFNHEGTRRGEEFVTRKITKGVARIKEVIRIFKKGTEGIAPLELVVEPIELGNLDARRDWSDAEDMVDAVWRMLNQEKYMSFVPIATYPDKPNYTTKELSALIKDYVVSSDENYSIRDFVTVAFQEAGIDGRWFANMKNDPLTERFVYVDDGIPVPDVVLVKVNPQFYRPAEVNILRGNSAAIRKELGWKPKSDFRTLVNKMVQNDLDN